MLATKLKPLNFIQSSFHNIKSTKFSSLNMLNVSNSFKCFNSKSSNDYEEAIKALNNLQSNALTIKNSILRQKNHLADTTKYLQRIGITPDKLDELSIIHVAGTKGKGSTCALTESILRAHNLKTGFFSSPHLTTVVERFRINGEPIKTELFAKYFWNVYKLLDDQKECSDDMPAYFKFLTVLCFKIFIEEKVDVAVIEVGIGGENDSTNVVRKTKTVGITSLGLEHTNLLGNSLKEIAWQKSGIIKPNSNVFTSLQPEECMMEIRKRAKEKNAKLFIVPDISEYKWDRLSTKFGVESKVQQLNASLAIQLSYNWLKLNSSKALKTLNINQDMILNLNETFIQGLQNCFWPGRCQIVQVKNLRFFLDGAHTKESMEVCHDWFLQSTINSTNEKFLIFNTTGDRDNIKLLQIIGKDINFVKALFVTNIPYSYKKCDEVCNHKFPYESQIKRVRDNYEYWISIFGEDSSYHFNDVYEALLQFNSFINRKEKQIDILVCGSLHLIGATLLALEEYEKTLNINCA